MIEVQGGDKIRFTWGGYRVTGMVCDRGGGTGAWRVVVLDGNDDLKIGTIVGGNDCRDAESVNEKTIYHIVAPDGTFTFLDKESMEASNAGALTGDGFVYVESQVTEEQYARLQSWHLDGAVTTGDGSGHALPDFDGTRLRIDDPEDEVDPTLRDA